MPRIYATGDVYEFSAHFRGKENYQNVKPRFREDRDLAFAPRTHVLTKRKLLLLEELEAPANESIFSAL